MKNFTILILIAMLCGCVAKTLDTRYDAKNYKKDLENLKAKGELSDSTEVLLSDYIICNQHDSTLLQKSYGDILNSAVYARDEAIKREQKKQEMHSLVTVKVLSKQKKYYYSEEEWMMHFYCEIQNNSKDKTITGVQFSISARTLNDEFVWASDGYCTIEGKMAPGKSIRANLRAQIESESTAMQKLISADVSKLKFDYQMQAIFFNDATSIEL